MKCPGGHSTVRCWSVASRGSEPRHHSRSRAELAINNQPSPINQSVTNLAVLNNGTNADIISTNIGSAFLSKTPEVFSHDADGNLLVDGQWTNTWNGSPHEIALLPDTSRWCCSERLSPDTKQHLHLISRGRNRLVTVETTAAAVSAGAPRQKVEWSYLPDGRWSQRVVSLWSSGAWVAQSTNRFLWDGVVLLAVLDGNNQVKQAYLRGSDLSGSTAGAGGVGGLLLTRNAELGTQNFVCYDGNGNVMALVDAGTGQVTAQYEYGPFGEVLRVTGPMAKANPFRFSTKYQDEETDLLYYGYRFLGVAMGRWVNRDPLLEEGGPNLYGFVQNAPQIGVDRMGLALYAFDGTANVPADETNVKLTSTSGHTGRARYLFGVGNDIEYRGLEAIAGKGFGYGVSSKSTTMLNALYNNIVSRNDTVIDVIGFSRGAVTAILFAEVIEKQKKTGKWPWCLIKGIRFMGLYDPVPGPTMRGRPKIPDIVDRAAIAYSIDEKRVAFKPSLYHWSSKVIVRGFRGGHSDVGGGYFERGLANISLEWMTQQANDGGASEFKIPDNVLSPMLQRHQETKFFNSGAFGVFAKRNLSSSFGIPPHPSIQRIFVGKYLYGQLNNVIANTGTYELYIDTVAPQNQFYKIGQRLF